MVSDVTMEKALFDDLEGLVLEEQNGDFALQTLWEERWIRVESETGNELFPAMAWI